MPLSIKDPETERLVRELSEATDLSLTRAIRRAVANELKRLGGGEVASVETPAERLSKVANGFARLSRHYPPLPGE
jgi:hypothetical protein